VSEETICKQDNINVVTVLNVVRIDISCRGVYEAQVLFEDIVARFEAGETLSIEPLPKPAAGKKPA
jgi:hypothetical protein